ncbi:MAG: VanW family protein, partial [Candidatus Yanofskybacteria bacterium]|nr:VanW family protein [Candidatus Yanofskybacteria bacterium]
ELVVKNGKLIPEFGGGICQVSTTLFRAATAAGLPILERRGHSLPVRYYNPQGFDATIYPGVIDLKFKNDTSNNILIQNKIEETRLSFEIYGSENDRKIEIDGPNILEQKPDGSMKTILTRKIVLPDGSIKEDIFRSTYKSPALFPLEKNPLE